jgi:hypothetical protein
MLTYYSEMIFEQQHKFRGDYTGKGVRPCFGAYSALELSTVSPVVATNDIVFNILLAKNNLAKQKQTIKILEKYGHSQDCREWIACSECI